MNDLILKWSRAELEFGGPEHIHLVEIVPYMSPKELEFIITQPINDGVKDAAMHEMKMRALIKSPWRDRLTVAALIAGIVSCIISLLKWISGH